MPTKLRRSFFWACHFPRHEGVTYMVDKIKQLGFYFPDMSNRILEFLTQCPCVLAKENRCPPYKGEKHIFATDVFHIVSLDLFEYDKQQYLTIMDVFSRMPFVYSIEDKTADAVKGFMRAGFQPLINLLTSCVTMVESLREFSLTS